MHVDCYGTSVTMRVLMSNGLRLFPGLYWRYGKMFLMRRGTLPWCDWQLPKPTFRKSQNSVNKFEQIEARSQSW